MAKRLAFGYLGIVIFLSISADFLANQKAIFIYSDNELEWFKEIDPSVSDAGFMLLAPVKFSNNLDLKNSNLSPSEGAIHGHYLGTDSLGRDILAGIIHGGRLSLGVSLLAMLFTSVIGIVIGGVAGFFGDDGFEISLAYTLTFLVTGFSFFFYVVHVKSVIPFLLTVVLLVLVYYSILRRIPYLNRRLFLPADFLSVKVIEVFSTIPGYFLIMGLVILIEPGWINFAIVLGLTRWVSIAKLVRAEMLKVRSKAFIESAYTLGVPQFRIFFKHALPNALGPLPYAFTFGVAGIMMMESTLSYFGVGLPVDSISWGNYLAGFKSNTYAWWVALFPGLMIFFTILSLHTFGRWLEQVVDPLKSKLTILPE